MDTILPGVGTELLNHVQAIMNEDKEKAVQEAVRCLFICQSAANKSGNVKVMLVSCQICY